LGAKHSVELGKHTFGGTRRWLPEGHNYRSEEMKDLFNGNLENRPKPPPITVNEQMQHATEYEAWKAIGNWEGGARDPSKVHNVMRLSVLYRLPYWKVL